MLYIFSYVPGLYQLLLKKYNYLLLDIKDAFIASKKCGLLAIIKRKIRMNNNYINHVLFPNYSSYNFIGGLCMSNFKIYVKSILIPVIVGGIVGLIIRPVIDYGSLNKPPLAPPGLLFSIIWPILYVLMGISYGILKSKKLVSPKISVVYYVQLAVNALWSIFFFSLKWRLFSFIWILVLDLLVIYMIVLFYKKNKVAGILQIPYLIWILFASYLNIAIYVLNSAK